MTSPPAAPAWPAPPAVLPGPRIAPRPQPTRRPARVQEIVAAARALLAVEGPEALTMRRLGEAVGVRAASLYKHLPGKPALEAALVELALFEFGDATHAIVDASTKHDVVSRLLAEYRRLARAESDLYRMVLSDRIDRTLLPAGLIDWSGEPFFRATGDPWVAQALFAAAHGAVILEIDQAYADMSDLDATWRALAAAFTRR